MLNVNDLSPAQTKWLNLLETLFPVIYDNGIINHEELKSVDAHFRSLREKDKRYKIGWPIWLITNNAISRGVYKLPKEVVQNIDPDIDHPYFEETESELRKFGIVV